VLRLHTCADVCPELYKIDEQGFAYVESGNRTSGLEAKAREGAAACPRSDLCGRCPARRLKGYEIGWQRGERIRVIRHDLQKH